MKRHLTYITLIALLFLVSCKHKSKYETLSNKIEAKSKNYKGVSVSSKPLLEDIALIKVSEGAHSFLIPDRKSKLASFACTECHSKPLKSMKSPSTKKQAHWDIKLVHANQNTMNCATCHDVKNMDHLISLTGKEVDMNLSYKLCAQCHASQFEDWKGGAHGKKIKGWAPPRASMTCVNCHNPHEPRFKTRWPARFNTQKVKERKEDIGH